MRKISKKLLSVLLAALMVITAIPVFTVNVSAATLNRDPSLDKYIYAYFCGNKDCQVRFAVSDDGYNFEALNGGNQILNTTADEIITFNGKVGMGNQKGARDPFIIKKPNAEGYYIIATDLNNHYSSKDGSVSDSNDDYNNSNILVWDVPSLASASDVKPWSVDTSGWFPEYFGTDSKFAGIWTSNNYFKHDGISNQFDAWAPEAIWDNDMGMYMMVWSSGLYGNLKLRCAYTSDFRTFYRKDGKTPLDGETQLDGSVNPDVIYDPGFQAIDANITYDKSTDKYYMYYKEEKSGTDRHGIIHLATADKCSGPYTEVGEVSTESRLEGPEVYQLLNGNYVFMGDNFATGTNGGLFMLYEGTAIDDICKPDNFIGSKVAINHLMPSHGAVSYIDTEDYNALIAAYGISNFDSPALDDVNTVNSHLVARYFTTEDILEDATGNGYNLNTANNLTIESNEEENKANYAVFKGNGILTTNYSNGSYGAVDTTQMLNDYNFNAVDGVTFSWSAKSTQTDVGYGAFYTQVQSGVVPGQLTYDASNKSHYNTAHTFVYTGKPTFSAGGQGVGAAVYGSENTIDDLTSFTRGWHDYTVTYVNGYMNLFIDGKLYNQQVLADASVRQGSPLPVSSINNEWFKTIFTGNLYFGASVFNGQDKMFDGAISDFRIYNKALNQDEIKASTILLNAEKIAQAIEKYESNMSQDGFIRTNYAETYKAYMDCKKAYDALTYGAVTNGAADDEINYDKLIETLNAKMDSSARFVKPGTVAVYDAVNTDNAIGEAYSNKLLYYNGNMRFADSPTDHGNVVGTAAYRDTYSSWGTKYIYLYYSIIMSDFVMLYDGDDENLPTAPVQVAFNYYNSGSSSKPRGMSKVINTNDEFDLATWHESSSGWVGKSASAKYEYTDSPKYTLCAGGTDTSIITTPSGSDTKWTGNSYLTLNPKNVTFNTDGTATKINTSFSIYNHDGNFLTTITAENMTNASATNHTLYSDYTGHYNSNYGYIVDYCPVKQAQERALDYIKKVQEYQVDNKKFLALLQAIDASTAIDLVGCFTGTTDVQASANEAQAKIKNAADAIDNAIAALQVKTEDKYESLRNEITVAQRIASSTNVNYTDDSYAQFMTMFNDAQDFMADVYGTNASHSDSNDYNHNDHAGIIAESLDNVLNDVLDVTTVNTTIRAKQAEAEMFDEKGNQNWTLTSWLDGQHQLGTSQEECTTLSKTNKYPVTDAVYYNLAGDEVHYDRVDKSGATNDNLVTNLITEIENISFTKVDSTEAYDAYDKAQERFLTSDQDAYTDAAVTKLNGYGSAGKALEYTPELNSVYAQYNGRIYKNTAANETDAFTKSVLTTINGGTDDEKSRKSYKVTFNYIVNGTPVNQYTEQLHYYGDVIDMAYSGDAKVVTWSVSQNGITTYINNQSPQFSHKVQCDTTINVYVTTSELSGVHEVQLIDYFGRAQVAYVSDNATVTVTGETIEFSDGVTLKNQGSNYITFVGFTIESGAVITEDTVIRARGMKDENTLQYTVTGGKFATGSDTTVCKVDETITVEASDPDSCLGIAIRTDSGYTMLTYASTYTFYGFPVAKAFNGQVDLVVVTKEFAAANNIDVSGVPQSFGVGVLNRQTNKLSMFCTMTTSLDASVKVVERGIIASTKATTADTLIKGASGVKTYRSSSDINSAMYMITFGTSGKDIYTRSYVAYEQTISMNGQEVNVPLVAYGDVVLSSAC